jgi:aminotransferase
MSLAISVRSEAFVQSEIRNMSIECDRVGGINMSQGICDLELPLPVRQGAADAMSDRENHYTRYDGLEPLRNAIAGKMASFNKVKCDPEKNIVVSAGATGAFYSACLALLNPGDEVLLFEPYYGYHVNTLVAAGAVPVFVPMTPPNWTFTIQDLEKAVSPRTKGIMICTPGNPTGKCFTQEELELIADFAIRHDIFVFTDEIYEYFVFDGRRHISPGTIERIADRTITISGYSKTFSITGWRIGYAVCHEKWQKMIGYINDLVYVCAPAPLQMGVARGITALPQEYYEGLCNEYYQKREQVCGTLKKVGIEPHVPQGAYYVLADVNRLPGRNSKEKAMFLLKTTGVASVPGSAFHAGGRGENLVRFCFAKSASVLDQACANLLKL